MNHDKGLNYFITEMNYIIAIKLFNINESKLQIKLIKLYDVNESKQFTKMEENDYVQTDDRRDKANAHKC